MYYCYFLNHDFSIFSCISLLLRVTERVVELAKPHEPQEPTHGLVVSTVMMITPEHFLRGTYNKAPRTPAKPAYQSANESP